MRVLMTTDAVGGVWSYCLSLARALEEHRVQISLATMGPAPSDHQRADVRRLSNVQLYESTFKLEWMQDPWEDVTAAGDWLLSLERRLRPDIVHLNGYVHAALSWSRPVLVVGHSCVGSWFEAVCKCQAPGQWNEYTRRVAQGLQGASLVTAPTRAALESLGRHYGTFRSPGPIHNGCDSTCHVAEKTEEIVFSAGRLWDPAKGIAVLDRAARNIRWPVLAAGAMKGPDGQWLKPESIQVLGCLGQRALRRWYPRASIFVLPSLYEPFGLTALEAALSGCALVVSDIPTLREIWSDAAIFVPPEDHDALARAVNGLIEDVHLRREYAHRARQQARMYTLGRMANCYHRVYLDLIQNAGTSAAITTNDLSRRRTAVTGA